MTTPAQTITATTPPITLTAAAIEHIRAQLASLPAAKGLRFGVKASGCSGWEYQLLPAENTQADDIIVKVDNDLNVFIDPISIPYIQGTEIDFVKQGLNRQFRFNNPNIDSECGCGESFSVKQ